LIYNHFKPVMRLLVNADVVRFVKAKEQLGWVM